MAGLPASRRQALQRRLAGFADAHHRDLPWRRTRDPWPVLVSEVMLQQTQVRRVVPAYRAFVARFPTPAACATAGPAEVVRAWAGLGYNRRALFLHRAATAIVERHGGAVPGDLDALLALPGVGAYTARAVQAFAFEADTGAVDTNVARLLARAVAGRPLRPAEAQGLADRLVPPGGGWWWNQAMLDLGARHCTTQGPDCTGCPWRRQCRWAAAGWADPDPAHRSAGTSRPQGRFDGSDRQGRGRMLAALRQGPVPEASMATVAGWPGQRRRAAVVVDALVAEGFARRRNGVVALV